MLLAIPVIPYAFLWQEKLAVDLFVFGGRKAHRVSVREASSWVIAWCMLAMAFAGLLWWYLNGEFGPEIAKVKTLEFLTGYLIEQSLSIDNMFVFVMIFSYFAVPPELQRRVLLYGVLGAIVGSVILVIGLMSMRYLSPLIRRALPVGFNLAT